MPVLAEYSDAVIVLRLVGAYSHDDLKQAFLGALPDDALPVSGVLIDVGQSTSLVTRSADSVNAISIWWARERDLFQGRIALVAPIGTTQYGMARLSAVSLEGAGLTVSVFGDATKAAAWLMESQVRAWHSA